MVTKTNVIEKNSRLKADELKSPWNRALTRNAEWPDKVKRGFKISFLSLQKKDNFITILFTNLLLI